MSTKNKNRITAKTKKLEVRRWLKYGLYAGLLLILVGAGRLLYDEYRMSRWDREVRAVQQYGEMVAEAAVVGMRSPIIDPLSNKAYVQPARLVFQGADDSPQLVFRGDKSVVQVGSADRIARASVVVKNATAFSFVDSYVPALQACTRQFVIQFTPGTPQVSDRPEQTRLLLEKRLADGRTAYIYQDRYCTGNADAVKAYLSTIGSY